MTTEYTIGEDVKELINNIIKKNNIKSVSDIKCEPGSEVGDGYVSKTIAVEVINGQKKFRIFIKSALNIKSSDLMPIEKLYKNEIYFYDSIYPAYLKFSKEREFEDGLLEIPKCYGTAENLVALENLREKNFVSYERTKLMNDDHIKLVLKAFAKFHAISFAFKDQKRELYDELAENTFDFYTTTVETFRPYSERIVNEFLARLDPVKDKDLLKIENLVDILADSLGSVKYTKNEYSILTQGDCHCNNMMFLYKDKSKTTPSEVMLVDWQLIRPASVVYDLTYFLYPVAPKEVLDNLDFYLKFYHDELSEKIRLLGSDPDRLYPFEILKKEWRKCCKYGLMTSFNIVRIMLAEKEEVFSMEDFNFDNMDDMINFEPPKLKKDEEYFRRMKILLEHMVKNNFL